jgi:hypothetical protein
MALALSLPPLDERPSHPPETRLARIHPWLEETLKRDTIEAAGVIGDALAATNRVPLSGSRRLELSEKYYATAQLLWPKLERQFSRATHPLSGNGLQAAKAALTLAAELSTAYKHLLARGGKRIYHRESAARRAHPSLPAVHGARPDKQLPVVLPVPVRTRTTRM